MDILYFRFATPCSFLTALYIMLNIPTAILILPKEYFIVDRIMRYINLNIDHILLIIV